MVMELRKLFQIKLKTKPEKKATTLAYFVELKLLVILGQRALKLITLYRSQEAAIIVSKMLRILVEHVIDKRERKRQMNFSTGN